MQEPAERAAKSSSQPRDADFGAEDAVHDSAEGDFRGRENLSVSNGQDQRARANLETARTAAPPAAAQTASGESANAAPDSGPTAKFPQSPVLGLTEIRGLDVFASEVVTKKHPRWGDFTEARQAEVTGLERNRTYDEVRVPVDKRAGLRIFPSRFVDTIKNVGTPEEALKSRIVVQATAARDPDKGEIFTFSPTARRESFRTVVALAATLHLQLYTRDVSQAYVSSDTTLSRTVFVIPPKALRRDHTTLWRLRKGLYGLPESGLLWYEKYRSYHTSQLRMNVDAADPCLYSRHTHDGRIDGMIVTQVDDSLQAGRESFMADEMRESSTFLSKGRFTVKASGTNFNGVTIVSTPTGFNVHQHQYIEQMPVGPCPRNARDFATLRGMASYATANTRPDVVCAVNMLSQVTPAAATEDNFISLDEAVLRLKNTPVSLRYEELDADVPVCLRRRQLLQQPRPHQPDRTPLLLGRQEGTMLSVVVEFPQVPPRDSVSPRRRAVRSERGLRPRIHTATHTGESSQASPRHLPFHRQPNALLVHNDIVQVDREKVTHRHRRPARRLPNGRPRQPVLG
jgi:Reverse transcriptase (RNA-dependent DNA polymerase)